MAEVDILIPTRNRPHALAATLTSLCSQTFQDFSVIISDQSDTKIATHPLLEAVSRILELHGNRVRIFTNLPLRGMAQQRQFLLDKSLSSYILFLDDDVVLEPFVIENLVKAIKEEGCGFVGMGLIGLSYQKDIRPNQQQVEFWETKVQPEAVTPGAEIWQRHKLHNAANLLHAQTKLKLRTSRPKKYKIAWSGGCTLYDTAKLKAIGGFKFWKKLPLHHAGEDVYAQLKLMRIYGGCGIMPSGAYHLELPTTISNRRVDAPWTLPL